MGSAKVAAGFVVFKKVDNHILYLLMQTSYGEHHWTPPKGHVDPEDKDELATAYRETEEESGLFKSDLKVYENSKHVLNYRVKRIPKTVIYWLAELINPEAKVRLSKEHEDFKWLQLEEACHIGKYDDLKNMLHVYDELIKKM